MVHFWGKVQHLCAIAESNIVVDSASHPFLRWGLRNKPCTSYWTHARCVYLHSIDFCVGNSVEKYNFCFYSINLTITFLLWVRIYIMITESEWITSRNYFTVGWNNRLSSFGVCLIDKNTDLRPTKRLWWLIVYAKTNHDSNTRRTAIFEKSLCSFWMTSSGQQRLLDISDIRPKKSHRNIRNCAMSSVPDAMRSAAH